MVTLRIDETVLCKVAGFHMSMRRDLPVPQNWDGEFEKAILAAMAVNEDEYREVLDAVDGHEREQGQLGQLRSVALQP